MTDQGNALGIGVGWNAVALKGRDLRVCLDADSAPSGLPIS